MSYASSLYLTGAEVGLSLLGLVLLLVSAWSGPKSARLLTVITGAALLAAAVFSVHLFDRESAAASRFCCAPICPWLSVFLLTCRCNFCRPSPCTLLPA